MILIRWLILMSSLVFITHCAAAPTPPPTIPPPSPTATAIPTVAATATPEASTVIQNENSIIFPAEAVQEGWWGEAGYREAGESWTPQPEQIAALEAALVPFLQNADDPWLKPDPPIWERLPDYERQYAGLVEEGQRIIYGNFFCDGEIFEWQQEWIVVDDGGDCYFQIKYDVERDRLFDLSVNGAA